MYTWKLPLSKYLDWVCNVVILKGNLGIVIFSGTRDCINLQTRYNHINLQKGVWKMPIVRQSEFPKDNLGPDVLRRFYINRELGGASLTVGEATIAPGGSIPLHIHPGHEEGILVMEGTLQGSLDDQISTLEAGDVIIAPQGIKHELVNNTNSPAKIIFIFPTLDVTRTVIEK